MSIFKFTTQKPSALKIWTTLMETAIAPREGYSSDQIKYRVFIMLQLAEDFKTTVSYCNRIISTHMTITELLTTTCRITAANESDFSDLSVSSEAFPHWVSSELYTPYYLTKMLCLKLGDPKLLSLLFDRDTMPDKEQKHWLVDYQVVKGLTAYKLYNSMHMDEMLPYITISYDRTPRPVMSKTEMHISIRDQLMHSIEVSDNHIIPENAKTTIPYFVLKTDTTVPTVPTRPQTRSSSSTRPFAIGDVVRLRSDLVPDKHYGGMKFHKEMRFDSITTISGESSLGNFQIIDNSFMYSPEMLEHAEGGTDASQ